jgi:N-acetylneuraminic acid mutarotase
MSPATETIVKRVVLLATVAGLASSLAFLLVACGGSSPAPSSRPPRGAAAHERWQVLPAAPIRVDSNLTSVWTGKEMVVSGVCCAARDGSFLDAHNVAAAYNPAMRTWRRLAPRDWDAADPSARAVVWTGREVVVWGAFKASAFDPRTDGWRALPPAPSGQGIAVWTGRELIGWGGGCCGDAWSGGSAYNPSTNTWRTLARSPLAPAQQPLGAWTGRELILVVSGLDPDGKAYPASLARAAAYNPTTDTWRRIAQPPARRLGGTAVWDGDELLVVGGSRVGLAYNLATNRWRKLAPMPSPRFGARAVWTGKRLMVWGAADRQIPLPVLAYDPKTDRWSSLPEGPFTEHVDPVAVWTGHRLLVWSGAGVGAALAPRL